MAADGPGGMSGGPRNCAILPGMTRRLPPLNALKAFEAAARLRHIGRAADELHVTRGAVSQQIRALEQWLGVALFVRNAQGLEPTAAGRALFPVIEESLDAIAAKVRGLSEPGLEGSLTVDGESRGRVFCANRPEGQLLVWSNRDLSIQTEATIAPGATVPEFWEWWTTAGPS